MVGEMRKDHAAREVGRVKFFSEERAFGFLAGDDGQDVFFHAHQCDAALFPIRADDRVSYRVHVRSDGRRAAMNIVPYVPPIEGSVPR